ncbi:hypothetical protein D3C81_1116020 [compost metagenome]
MFLSDQRQHWYNISPVAVHLQCLDQHFQSVGGGQSVIGNKMQNDGQVAGGETHLLPVRPSARVG